MNFRKFPWKLLLSVFYKVPDFNIFIYILLFTFFYLFLLFIFCFVVIHILLLLLFTFCIFVIYILLFVFIINLLSYNFIIINFNKESRVFSCFFPDFKQFQHFHSY